MEYDWYSTDKLKWILSVGVPNLIIWIFGWPLIAYIILFRNKHRLNNEYVKQYYLMLYQGLTDQAFYWEFVNTIKKASIIGINTVFSTFSISYRILMWLILMIIMIRVQIRVKPYKAERNNKIEIKASTVGLLLLYWGILFRESSEDEYPGFKTFLLLIIISMNILFVAEWLYMFLLSLNISNHNFKCFLYLLGVILCKKQIKLQYDQTQDYNENSVKDEEQSDALSNNIIRYVDNRWKIKLSNE